VILTPIQSYLIHLHLRSHYNVTFQTLTSSPLKYGQLIIKKLFALEINGEFKFHGQVLFFVVSGGEAEALYWMAIENPASSDNSCHPHSWGSIR
jgi:hypothetical protein